MMRLFISAGEPSGDMHGANLIRSLRQQIPSVEIAGFGGDQMLSAGCDLLFPLCDFAVVGLAKVLGSLSQFAAILDKADRSFRRHRPDALVMIDYPGFHWWLAKRAREHGIPVVYFVPPQIWAWANWRHRKMRRLVDEALSGLPFEVDWLRARHIPARFIGHPYFDELHRQQLGQDFLAAEKAKPGTIVGLLPGSRNQEVFYNLDPLLRAAQRIHARRPETRFLVACFKEEHRQKVAAKMSSLGLPIEAHVGKTPEILHLSHSCLSVSGSVSLELLFHATPSVMIYHQHWLNIAAGRMLIRSPHISLVNLLANKRLFPEYFSAQDQSEQMAAQVIEWLEKPMTHAALQAELVALRDRIAVPGACERAARRIVEIVEEKGELRRAG